MVHGFSFKAQVGYLEHPFSCKELSFISIGVTARNALSKWLQLLRQSKKIFTNTGHIGLRVCIETWKRKSAWFLYSRPDGQTGYITEALPYFGYEDIINKFIHCVCKCCNPLRCKWKCMKPWVFRLHNKMKILLEHKMSERERERERALRQAAIDELKVKNRNSAVVLKYDE